MAAELHRVVSLLPAPSPHFVERDRRERWARGRITIQALQRAGYNPQLHGTVHEIMFVDRWNMDPRGFVGKVAKEGVKGAATGSASFCRLRRWLGTRLVLGRKRE